MSTVVDTSYLVDFHVAVTVIASCGQHHEVCAINAAATAMAMAGIPLSMLVAATPLHGGGTQVGIIVGGREGFTYVSSQVGSDSNVKAGKKEFKDQLEASERSATSDIEQIVSAQETLLGTYSGQMFSIKAV